MPGRGRPRGFDSDAALDRAVEVFWQRGYEGASLGELTSAMGINKPSLYAAFGNKEQLFRRAVTRYAAEDMAYARDALHESSAYQVADALLRGNVEAVTRPGRPAGCLSLQGGTSGSADNGDVPAFLAAKRLAGEQRLADRFHVAVADEDLRPDTDPAALARFVMSVADGHAIRAAAGVLRDELLASVEIALHAVAHVSLRPGESRTQPPGPPHGGTGEGRGGLEPMSS